jgi:hypothetical protein
MAGVIANKQGLQILHALGDKGYDQTIVAASLCTTANHRTGLQHLVTP